MTRVTTKATQGEMIAVASTPIFASSSSRPSNASVATSSETVKPMPAVAAPAASAGNVTVEPRAAEHPPRAEPRRAEDARGLADHVGGHDPDRHRRGRRRGDQVAVDRDPRVREREQRHDHQARPRVQPELQPLVRRDRRGEAGARGVGELGRRLLAERARQLGAALEVVARRRIGARHQPDREARRSPRRCPDSNIATQMPKPTSTAAGPRQGPAKRSPTSTPNRPSATASATSETSSV